MLRNALAIGSLVAVWGASIWFGIDIESVLGGVLVLVLLGLGAIGVLAWATGRR
jgi:hypothetical protein